MEMEREWEYLGPKALTVWGSPLGPSLVPAPGAGLCANVFRNKMPVALYFFVYFYYLESFSEPLAAPSALLAFSTTPPLRAGTTTTTLTLRLYPLPLPTSPQPYPTFKNVSVAASPRRTFSSAPPGPQRTLHFPSHASPPPDL